LMEDSTSRSLSGSAGTEGVLVSNDAFRESSRSPTLANITPTFDVGRQSSFVGVMSSTGTLCGSGVSLPGFVPQEQDDALKAVHDRLAALEKVNEERKRENEERKREYDEIRRLMKGESIATDETPPAQTITPAVTSP